MKHTFFGLRISALVFISLLLGAKANAAGYDGETPPISPPLPSDQAGSENAQAVPGITPLSQPEATNLATPTPSLISMPSRFNWNKWGSPYQAGNIACRENSVNLVCLPSQMAQKLGWKIPFSTK